MNQYKSLRQAIYCPNCNMIFSICSTPFCYTDKDWMRDLRKYVKQGYMVEEVNHKDVVKERFGKCKCAKPPGNPDQLKLEVKGK